MVDIALGLPSAFFKDDPGTTVKPKLKLLKAEFGDGYTQVTRYGLNHKRKTISLTWETLTPTQASEIVTFFESHGGDTPFYYTPSDESTPIKWTCEEWDDQRKTGGLRKVTATFEQCFNLMT